MWKVRLIWLFLLISSVLYARSGEIDLARVKVGNKAPVFVKTKNISFLKFRQSEKGVPAALITEKFNFSKGGRIDLEFKIDPEQSNPMPRLIESSDYSIQLKLSPTDPAFSKIVKILIYGKKRSNYLQIRLPLSTPESRWNKVSFEYFPSKKIISLQLNNGKVVSRKYNFEMASRNQQFIIGSNALNNGTRGFNGDIRNLKITVPYSKADIILPKLQPSSKVNKSAAYILNSQVKDKIIDLKQIKAGTIAPKFVSNSPIHYLSFSADTKKASAALVPEIFDFSHGCRIELEFQDNAKQSNVFPRLLETSAISIHLQVDPQNPGTDRIVKVLVKAKNQKDYAQIRIGFRSNLWSHLVFEYLPNAKVITLQCNDSKQATEYIDFELALKKQSLLLGASSLKNSNRGFNGKIRNLKISAPYDRKINISPISGFGTPTVNGQVIKHYPVTTLTNRHYAFPGITRLSNGTLISVFREGQSHVCPYGRICVAFSLNGGTKWSAPVCVADTTTDERDPSIQTLPDGRLLITYTGFDSWLTGGASKRYPGPTAYAKQNKKKQCGAFYLFSSNNGLSWENPVKVPVFATHGPLFYKNHFYSPLCIDRNGKRYVELYRGNANAKSWEKIGVIGVSDSGNDALNPVYQEPNICVLNDGTFVSAIRVPSDGYMRISFSHDQGKTWSPPAKTKVRGFPQHLLPLKDGRLLVVYGYRYRPFGIRACISHDGGKTWDMDNEMILQNNGTGIDLGYPVSIELKKGKVITCYYNITKKFPHCFIECAIYKP